MAFEFLESYDVVPELCDLLRVGVRAHTLGVKIMLQDAVQRSKLVKLSLFIQRN